MWNRRLKITVLVVLVAGVVIGLRIGACQKTDWKNLMRENVEALTTPEAENPYYPCVPAIGFCLINGIDMNGVALAD